MYKLFHQAVHTPKFWKIVDTNSEFTLSSFHSVFGHAKHITHLGFRYSQRQLGCRNLIDVLQQYKLLAFSFSPCWGPPNLWKEFLQDFKHVEFGEDLLDHVKRVNLPGFLYDDEVE